MTSSPQEFKSAYRTSSSLPAPGSANPVMEAVRNRMLSLRERAWRLIAGIRRMVRLKPSV